MKLIEPILAWSAEMTAFRRDLHMHPELAFEEERTSQRVAEKLKGWGIETHTGIGQTGVVGVIRGHSDNGRAIGLRADMDALPMQELNTFEHASQTPGKMHACGHDGHTTMLLTAARYLAQQRNFVGTVYVIFQPAEEGQGGARRMIQDGLFQRFPMQAVFGMHNWPGMPTGKFGLKAGPIMASSNRFHIHVQGRGAHAAMPNLGIDPVMAAVQVAQSLQSVVSRNLDPLEPAVLSVTQIHAGSADNVIPTEASLRGTVRTFSDATLDMIESRLRDIARLTCEALACTATITFDREYPPTLNDEAETHFCTQLLQNIAGSENIDLNIQPSMGAEDFAFMLRETPGCYVWVGNGGGEHRAPGYGPGPCMLHNGSYDFNDELIPLGASYWVALAQNRLATDPA